MQTESEQQSGHQVHADADRIVFYLRRAIFLGWTLLPALYLFALRPLQIESNSLNRALDAASLDLANAPIGTPENNQKRFDSLRNQIQQTQRRSEAWLSRVAFSAESLTGRLESPEEWLQKSRARRRDQFQALAEERQIVVAENDLDILLKAPIISGRWTGVDRESGLWAHHETMYQAMALAAVSGVNSISSLQYLAPRPHFTEDSESFLEDLPVYFKVRGTKTSVFSFLSALPLSGAELREAEFDDLPAMKKPLFLDSLEMHALKDPLGNVEARVVVIGLYALNSTSIRREMFSDQ